jgi:hypothetical protein
MSYNCFTEINRICHRNRIMLISLFKLTSIYNSSILLSEMPFSNNQMVNTRSGGGQDIANQQNPVPPPPPNPAMDPATQQFFAAQMQLIQNLTATVQNIQAKQNQPQPPPPPHAPRDKHKEFMSHHPPTYSNSTDTLDADDWLKTVTKKLERAQCTDSEMVLYASRRLEGLASDWWDAYSTTHPAPNTITWQQFRDAFCAHHIPDGVLKLKQREFLSLKQGNMSMNEYLDKFTQLSRYASDKINTYPKRQERFLDGLIGPLNYQLQSHTFPDFATLLNKAIGLENKRKELGEKKSKFQSQGQSSSSSRPRYSFPQNPQFRSGGQSGKYPQNIQLQRSFQQPQRFNPQTPRTPNF